MPMVACVFAAMRKIRMCVRAYQGIIRWLRCLEQSGIDFLPIEDARIVNECGYIYEGSTNQIQFIEPPAL